MDLFLTISFMSCWNSLILMSLRFCRPTPPSLNLSETTLLPSFLWICNKCFDYRANHNNSEFDSSSRSSWNRGVGGWCSKDLLKWLLLVPPVGQNQNQNFSGEPFLFVFLNRPITKLNGLDVHSTLYIVLLSWNEQWKWIFSYIAASQLTHHNHNSSSNNNCLNSSVIAHNFLSYLWKIFCPTSKEELPTYSTIFCGRICACHYFWSPRYPSQES